MRMAGNGAVDPKHDWVSSRTAFNGGRNDGFLLPNPGVHQNEVMSYYGDDRIPFLYALAREFTVCDRWFSSVMGPTWPNRFYLHAATAGRPQDQPADGAVAAAHDLGADGRPLLDRQELLLEQAALVLARVPGQELLGRRRGHARRRWTTSSPTPRAATLPNLAIIDPDFEANDGHPPHDLALCEAFVASVYRALAESPQWSRSLLVVMFDEHGGFFDHVPPPADRRSESRVSPARLPRAGDRRRAAGAAGRGGVDAVRARVDRGDAEDALRDRQPGPAHGRRQRSVVVPRSRPRSSRPAPSLPTVALSESRTLRAPLRATSQPEMHALAATRGVPDGPRRSALGRGARPQLAAPRPGAGVGAGDRVIAWLMLALSLLAADPAAPPQRCALPAWLSGGRAERSGHDRRAHAAAAAVADGAAAPARADARRDDLASVPRLRRQQLGDDRRGAHRALLRGARSCSASSCRRWRSRRPATAWARPRTRA